MTATPLPFAFNVEFTPDGDVIGGLERRFVSRDEADSLVVNARREAENQTRRTMEANAFASVDKLAANIAPVQPMLSRIADQLRREAAELAMAAARAIAGAALDHNGESAAIEAIAEAVSNLKAKPSIVVSATAESLPAIEARLAKAQAGLPATTLTFRPDPKAKPGDWKVEWAEGAVGFSRDEVERAVAAAVEARLQAPVEPQLDLFRAA